MGLENTAVTLGFRDADLKLASFSSEGDGGLQIWILLLHGKTDRCNSWKFPSGCPNS